MKKLTSINILEGEIKVEALSKLSFCLWVIPLLNRFPSKKFWVWDSGICANIMRTNWDKNMSWGLKVYLNGDIRMSLFIKTGKEFYAKFIYEMGVWLWPAGQEFGWQDKKLRSYINFLIVGLSTILRILMCRIKC